MIISDYSIVSPDIDALAASDCRLLIKANEQFLHYIIIYKNDTVVALKFYQFIPASEKAPVEWLEELFDSDELLKKEWKTVDIIYAVPQSQLIPAVLFDNSYARELLNMATGDLKKDTLLTTKTDGAEIYTLFHVPTEIEQFFQNQFTSVRTRHYHDVLAQEGKQDGVQAMFYPNELLVKVIKGDRLQLLQNYTYQTPEDAAYYLLAIYVQYDFSPDELPLHISGMIVRDSAIYEELIKYFRAIEMSTIPASLTLAPNFADYPPHFFSPILKLAVCAS